MHKPDAVIQSALREETSASGVDDLNTLSVLGTSVLGVRVLGIKGFRVLFTGNTDFTCLGLVDLKKLLTYIHSPRRAD